MTWPRHDTKGSDSPPGPRPTRVSKGIIPERGIVLGLSSIEQGVQAEDQWTRRQSGQREADDAATVGRRATMAWELRLDSQHTSDRAHMARGFPGEAVAKCEMLRRSKRGNDDGMRRKESDEVMSTPWLALAGHSAQDHIYSPSIPFFYSHCPPTTAPCCGLLLHPFSKL